MVWGGHDSKLNFYIHAACKVSLAPVSFIIWLLTMEDFSEVNNYSISGIFKAPALPSSAGEGVSWMRERAEHGIFAEQPVSEEAGILLRPLL